MPSTTAAAPPADDARRARLAVAALFAVNGLVLANIVPWFPVIKDDLGLTNTAFGAAIAAAPFGGLLLGMAAGPLVARAGSGPTATRSALVQLLALPAVALAPTWLTFAGALFLMGATDAVTDAAMNAHALRVQRRYGRSIITSFHALWSLGGVGGGLLGAAVIALGVPRAAHLTATAVVLAVVVLAAARWQLAGAEDAEQAERADAAGAATADAADGTAADAAAPATVAPDAAPAGADAGGGSLLASVRTAPLLLAGIAGLLVMSGAVEDSSSSWAAVHLRDSVGASAFVTGLGFVAFQTLMVVGRMTGDRVVDRLGARAVARSGCLLAAVGMAAVAAGPSAWVVVAGFALAGLGVSPLFPLGFAAAGNIPGVRSADGVAITSWLARLSFLVMPPLIGTVADATSLRWGLALVCVCALVGAALAVLLSGRATPQPAADAPGPA